MVFRSKTQVFALIDKLNSLGIRAVTTGTPKEAAIGCGLSVKTDYSRLPVVKNLLRTGYNEGFYAAYSVEIDGLRSTKVKIM